MVHLCDPSLVLYFETESKALAKEYFIRKSMDKNREALKVFEKEHNEIRPHCHHTLSVLDLAKLSSSTKPYHRKQPDGTVERFPYSLVQTFNNIFPSSRLQSRSKMYFHLPPRLCSLAWYTNKLHKLTMYSDQPSLYNYRKCSKLRCLNKMVSWNEVAFPQTIPVLFW